MPSAVRRGLRRVWKWWPLMWLRRVVEFAVVRALAGLIPRLPRTAALRCARLLGRVAYWVDRRRRRIGQQNLRRAVEHGGLDLRGRRPQAVLLACYQNFARSLIDLFWFSRLSATTMDRWVNIENEPAVRQQLPKHGGAIFLTPHYGIFEWSSLIVGFRGLKLDIIAQDFSSEAVTDVFRRARQHSGHRVLSRNGGMLKLLRTAKQGGNIAMLPDLNIRPQRAAALVRMFGLPAYLTTVHVDIARRCGSRLFVAVVDPHDDGRVTMRVLDVIAVDADADPARVQQLTQRVWDRFEEAIRNRPELWLWMYRHWRHQPLAKDRCPGLATAIDNADRPSGDQKRRVA